MTRVLTAAQVADALGVSPRRVRVLARARRVGQQLPDGTWLFVPEDIARLRPRPRAGGRPPFRRIALAIWGRRSRSFGEYRAAVPSATPEDYADALLDLAEADQRLPTRTRQAVRQALIRLIETERE